VLLTQADLDTQGRMGTRVGRDLRDAEYRQQGRLDSCCPEE